MSLPKGIGFEPSSPTRSIAEFDPLSPLSFKRRPTSAGLKETLLSSLQSIKPTHIRMPSNPILTQEDSILTSRFNKIISPPLPTPSPTPSPTEEAPPNLPPPFEATPLPKLPMIVLCICMFGEFLSASTAGPFLFFMLESMGVGSDENGGGGEAAVGFWSGIVASTFFLSQFLTSLLWVEVANKHGRRAVLFSSLLGSSIFLLAFGTSRNLKTAICIRLGQGIFNGAVGVARGAVQNITDSTNEQRAFIYIGLTWGLGGIVGSIIGGLTEHPVQNLPFFFKNSTLFAEYPYLLPCMISSSVTCTGAILSLFLSPDGGSRIGGISLPSEKDVEDVASTVGSLPRKINNKISTYFKDRRSISGTTNGSPSDRISKNRSVSVPYSPIPISLPNERESMRPPMRTSGYGSAYGFGNPLSMSRTSTRQSGSAYGFGDRFPRGRRGVGGIRSTSVATSTRYAPDYDNLQDNTELNFAQRLMLANEGAVFDISDIFVAAATQNDDQYSTMDLEEDDNILDDSVFEDDESRIEYDNDGEEIMDDEYSRERSNSPSMEDLRGNSTITSLGNPLDLRRIPSTQSQNLRSPLSLYVPGQQNRAVSSGSRLRRASATSSVRPAIFNNTGLSAASLATAISPGAGGTRYSNFEVNPMESIEERPSNAVKPLDNLESQINEGKTLMQQLPLVLIVQYALLALHNTTCDQVFMSFLVTPIPSGGLGLKAANFAALVALMFFASMIWQFLFYPRVSKPDGPLSHLGMFRLGLALYLPVYALFPQLRGLLREEGNLFVMTGMVLLSSIRYLGNALCYTSMSILINATTPIHLIPFANGLAQSAVSLARFIGPISGGSIFAYSIADGPTAHPWPFNYALGFNVTFVICFIGFLFSFRIK